VTTESYRHVPYDICVEQSVLGYLLLDNKSIDTVAADLQPEHFYDPLHQRLFEMLVALSCEGRVSPLVLHAAMKSDPGLQEVGGLAYLAGLAEAAPALPDIRQLARILLELAMRRELIRTGEDIVADAYEASRERPARAIADAATETLLRIGGAVTKPSLNVYEVGEAALQQAERVLHGEKVPSIPTGLSGLDGPTGGLQGGEHLVVAARSSMGNTGLLVALCRAAALAGHPVLVHNMDMRSASWAQRTMCDLDLWLNPGEAPIWTSKFRRGTLSNVEIERLTVANRMLCNLPYEINDEASMTLTALMSRSRAFAARHPGKIGLIAVDFLQRVKPDKRMNSRTEESEISDAAYGMRELAKMTGWVVVSAAQLKNKGAAASTVTKAEERPPTGEDIRGSGAIEMAADIVISPFRKAFFVRQREPDKLTKPTEWAAWRAELTECDNHLRMLCFKFRESDTGALTGDFWCDMGSNSIRDERPTAITPQEQAAREMSTDLLWHLNTD